MQRLRAADIADTSARLQAGAVLDKETLHRLTVRPSLPAAASNPAKLLAQFALVG